MDEVITYMLEAEKEASRSVAEAETEAQKIRQSGHQEAQELLEKAEHEAQKQADQLVEARKQEAKDRKERELAAFEEELVALRQSAESGLDEAVHLAVHLLRTAASAGG